ncbi:MAG: hypothetical protein K0R90_1240, partial [Oscillospiraceae bacterium]|nr:hypothetical protein [Oscillospiraceae bacterium]
MRSFNGTNKNKKYFEGWYFKHSKGNQVMALIPGINVDENGVKSAFIQVITNEQSYQITYSYKKFYASPQKFFVKIGNNVFCKKGIKLDIQEKNLSLKGTIRYGNFHK